MVFLFKAAVLIFEKSLGVGCNFGFYNQIEYEFVVYRNQFIYLKVRVFYLEFLNMKAGLGDFTVL
jgi:hypothetical protein